MINIIIFHAEYFSIFDYLIVTIKMKEVQIKYPRPYVEHPFRKQAQQLTAILGSRE